MNFRELFLLTLIFSLMFFGTIINLIFSNTIGETCGLIHPFVFEAEVSIVQSNSGITRSSDISALPVNPNDPFEDSLDTYLRIYDGNRQLLAENDDIENSLSSGIEPFFVREDMTIIIEVGTYADSYEGRYELVIEEAVLPPVTPITLGTDVEGQIGQRETVRYSYDITADELLNVTVDGNDNTGDVLDTVLAIFGESGEMLAFNDDFEGFLSSGIENFGVETAQTIVIEVGTYEGAQNGTFTLTTEAGELLRPTGDAISVGRAIEDNIEEGESLTYAVAVDSPQLLTISVAGIDGFGEELDTVLRAYSETGILLAENDDFNGLSSTINNLLVRDDQIIVEVSTYAESYSGDFTLLVEEGEVVPAEPIEAGTSVAGSLGFEERVRYQVTVEEGALLSIAVEGVDEFGDPLDTVLRLYSSDNEELIMNDDVDAEAELYNSAIVDFAVPEAGDYIIEIGTYQDSVAGDFTLEVNASDAEAEADEATPDNPAQQWSINQRGSLDSIPTTVQNEIKLSERDRYTLTLSADQAVNIYLREAPPEPVSIWDLWSYMVDNEFDLQAEFWPTCLEFYGYVSEGAFIINDSGFSRWVERSKIAEEITSLCNVEDYEQLQQGSGACQLQAGVGLTQFGQLLLYVILPGLAIVLPIFTVFLLQDDADLWWFSGLLLVAIFVLTSALLYVHLGTVSGIEALSEFAYGMFGGTATGAAIAFITKVLENFSGRANSVHRATQESDEMIITPDMDDTPANPLPLDED